MIRTLGPAPVHQNLSRYPSLYPSIRVENKFLVQFFSPGVCSICSPFLSPGVCCWMESAQAFQTAGGDSPAFQPTLSLSLQNIPYPAHPSEKERETHTESQRGRKTETQWEATGGDERKMLTFGVFQNDTSHLTKHSQRIQSPCTRDFNISALTRAFNSLLFSLQLIQ